MSVIESNSMDVVTCCYGFMFCAEPEKAFAEVERVLKPGGCLITTVWVEFPIMSMVLNIMTEVLGTNTYILKNSYFQINYMYNPII